MGKRGQIEAETEKARIRDLYARLAGSYDGSLPLFRLAGFREGAYRRELVAGLGLSPGDTVVDLGCGTGRNFPDLRAAVGAGGTIIGVDFSPAMLARARRRVERRGWGNVTLVEADAADFGYPANLRAVAEAFALGTMPDYERAITRATEALPRGAAGDAGADLPGARPRQWRTGWPCSPWRRAWAAWRAWSPSR